MEYDRLVAFESTLMDHADRMLDMQHRVNLLEAQANRDMPRARADEPNATQGPVSLTAEQAEGTPIWTEDTRPPLPLPAPPHTVPLHTLNMLEAEAAQHSWDEVTSLTGAANQ